MLKRLALLWCGIIAAYMRGKLQKRLGSPVQTGKPLGTIVSQPAIHASHSGPLLGSQSHSRNVRQHIRHAETVQRNAWFVAIVTKLG